MTTNCHHQKLIRAEIVFGQLVHRKLRLARRRVEDSIARRVWEIEPAGLAHARVVIVKAGHAALDRITDLVVVNG